MLKRQASGQNRAATFVQADKSGSFGGASLPVPTTLSGGNFLVQAHERGSEQVAQAAVIGQMTTGFPVSPLTPATFLLTGLCEIDLGEHQRFTTPYLFAASVLMALACVALGVFSF